LSRPITCALDAKGETVRRRNISKNRALQKPEGVQCFFI
jgi:hypothetical protein